MSDTIGLDYAFAVCVDSSTIGWYEQCEGIQCYDERRPSK